MLLFWTLLDLAGTAQRQPQPGAGAGAPGVEYEYGPAPMPLDLAALHREADAILTKYADFEGHTGSANSERQRCLRERRRWR